MMECSYIYIYIYMCVCVCVGRARYILTDCSGDRLCLKNKFCCEGLSWVCWTIFFKQYWQLPRIIVHGFPGSSASQHVLPKSHKPRQVCVRSGGCMSQPGDWEFSLGSGKACPEGPNSQIVGVLGLKNYPPNGFLAPQTLTIEFCT